MPGEEMELMPQAARKRGRHDLRGTSDSVIAGTGRPARFNDGECPVVMGKQKRESHYEET